MPPRSPGTENPIPGGNDRYSNQSSADPCTAHAGPNLSQFRLEIEPLASRAIQSAGDSNWSTKKKKKKKKKGDTIS